MIETREVLAAAYSRNRRGRMLSHAYDTSLRKVLCGRVQVHSLADRRAGDVRAEPTCETCRARDPRFQQRGGDK